MKIYIDFDDVICETARYFTILVKEMFGIDIPYNKVIYFDLKKAFNINTEQYEKLMAEGHLPENLLAYEETEGAAKVINKWLDEGHDIYVITGRPYESYEPSRKWLDEHGLSRIPLYCVDKYGREKANKGFSYSMSLEKLYEMDFDFAVEDSPVAFEHIMHFEKCTVAVFDRPWNRNEILPNEMFQRCIDWNDVDKKLIECNNGYEG